MNRTQMLDQSDGTEHTACRLSADKWGGELIGMFWGLVESVNSDWMLQAREHCPQSKNCPSCHFDRIETNTCTRCIGDPLLACNGTFSEVEDAIADGSLGTFIQAATKISRIFRARQWEIEHAEAYNQTAPPVSSISFTDGEEYYVAMRGLKCEVMEMKLNTPNGAESESR